MSDDGYKYWPDGFMECVRVKDGKPVRYCSVARRTKDDEPALAARIKQLTGCAVRFGAWEQFEPVGKDFESSSEVDLIALDDAIT